MQDDEARGRGLQGCGQLIGRTFAREQRTDPGLQGLRGGRGGHSFRQHHGGNLGGEVGFRKRFDDGLGRFGNAIDQKNFRLRVGKFAAHGVDTRGVPDDFNILRFETILQGGASERRSGDEEDANHAAAALLGLP